MSVNVFDDAIKRLSTVDTGESQAVPTPSPPSRAFRLDGLATSDGAETSCRSLDCTDARPSTDPKLRCDAAVTLRDSMDHYTTGPIYPQFLKRVMPIFINILRGPCIFQSTSNEQVRLPRRQPSPSETWLLTKGATYRSYGTASSRFCIVCRPCRRRPSLSSPMPKKWSIC